MLQKILKVFFGDKSEKDVKEIMPYVGKTNEIFATLNHISHDELRQRSNNIKKKISDYVSAEVSKIKSLKEQVERSPDMSILDKEKIFEEADSIEKNIDKKLEEILLELLPEAFAVIKETARRFKENEELIVTATEFDKKIASKKSHVTLDGDKAIWKNSWDAAGTKVTWDMVHYDVQLIGGVALHQGKIAEMQTGEGKTLVATLGVFLNALAGRGVHLVTVNDYLAKRDSEWMGPLYEFHGLSVDCIDKHQPNSPERREAYQADITFGTNNEFGFDYLRDNMVNDPEMLVQRKHHFAIVDEVDSVLVDDARTPLIISGPTPQGDKQEYLNLKPIIERLSEAQRKLVTNLLTEAKKGLVLLSADEPGLDKKEIKEKLEASSLALLRCFRGLPKNKALIKFLSEPGIKTQLQRTENFYLQDQAKEMPKVDKELFFVIDEKNNSIELTEKGIDLISGSDDPNLYILPDLGAVMAEIEKSEAPSEEKTKKKEKLVQEYQVKSERIHAMNQLLKAYNLFEKEVEYVVIENKVKIVDEQTGRIMEGRRYSDGLHQAIEAKENVKVEAATQTYATITLQNYFRMYHKLAGMTGTAETEAKEFWDIYKLDVVVIPTNRPISRKDEEDLVYKTAREKYNAIIDEVIRLRGAGRPVLVGTTTVEISELLSRMLKMRNIPHQVLNAKLHQKEADIVAEAGKAGTVTIATNMAGRGTDIKLGPGVKEAGGLAIIGTERHDSRRVDRQLRGRAGRQGDPGSSQFFVCLEDNLMRLFGSERIARMMDTLGHKEGEVIQHRLITRSIERAQKKVEENNFGIRKRLLEYDDVMNAQRNAIYKRRKNALFGERLDLDIDNIFFEQSENIINAFIDSRDFENFNFELIRALSIESPVSPQEFAKIDVESLIDIVYQKAKSSYSEKCVRLRETAMPVIRNVYENQSATYENIVIPFTDGMKGLRVVVNIKNAVETNGANLIKEMEKVVTLGIIDNEWKEHLRDMDELRQSVQHAVYEQKDPLLIYKLESFDLFKQMMLKVNNDILGFLAKATVPLNDDEPQQVQQRVQAPTQPKLQTSREDITQASHANAQIAAQHQGEQPIKRIPIVADKKIGRNDRVKVLNLRTGATEEMKYKQAEALIQEGIYQLIEE
ncbi:MAG: preprotein translocase subunit SecA [Flavobacteriales bacterium]